MIKIGKKCKHIGVDDEIEKCMWENQVKNYFEM